MKKRYGIVVSDTVLLVFLGLVYSWSIFKKPLAEAYGWNDSQLTWTFTICMFMFCIGGFCAARLAKYTSHRNLTWFCGVLIGSAFYAMGYMSSLWQIYVLYGVVIGFSAGAVYNCVLATGNKWFPDKGGMVAGILLMAFGAGSLFLSPLSNFLIMTYGLTLAFAMLGIMFVFIFLIGGMFVVVPNEEDEKVLQKNSEEKEINTNIIEFTPRETLKTESFWIYFLWCALVSSIGIGLLGQIATISSSVGMNSAKAALMVSLFAIFNGIGRLYFGSFYDRRGREVTMTIFGIGFILGGLSLAFGIIFDSIILVIVSLVLFGIAYGGVTPTNANFARSFFGNKNYATNFSLVNFNLLISVFLGQYIGSTLYMKTGGYVATAIAITILSIAALIIQFFIKPARKKELDFIV